MYYDSKQLSNFGFIDKISYMAGKYVIKVVLPKTDFELLCDAPDFKAVIDTINLMIESLKEKVLNKNDQQTKDFKDDQQTKDFNDYERGFKDGYNIGFTDGEESGYIQGFKEGINSQS